MHLFTSTYFALWAVSKCRLQCDIIPFFDFGDFQVNLPCSLLTTSANFMNLMAVLSLPKVQGNGIFPGAKDFNSVHFDKSMP